MLTAFNHSGNYGHPPANFLCRIEGERERERENNCELYSSQWNISLQDINSPIIRTSRESRVRQIDLNKGVHLYSCRSFFFFFFSFDKSYLPRFLQDLVTNYINSKERNFLIFPLLLSAFAREISIVDIEIDCHPMRIDITILSP